MYDKRAPATRRNLIFIATTDGRVWIRCFSALGVGSIRRIIAIINSNGNSGNRIGHYDLSFIGHIRHRIWTRGEVNARRNIECATTYVRVAMDVCWRRLRPSVLKWNIHTRNRGAGRRLCLFSSKYNMFIHYNIRHRWQSIAISPRAAVCHFSRLFICVF